MREPVLKGLIHLGLGLASLAEARTSQTKVRSLLLGAATGWHLNSALYHFFLERDDNA